MLNIFNTQVFYKIFKLLPKALLASWYIASLLLLIFITYKSFHSILDLDTIISCMDNHNNHDWRNIRIGTDLGTLYNVGLNTGFSYAAYRGAMHFSTALSAAPISVRAGVFVGTYGAIYFVRSLLPNNPINLNLYLGNFNNGGNRFNSPLEYGEALDRSSIFMDGMIGLNFIILLFFNILIMILVNRAIIPHILKWLEDKLTNNNIIYKIIERTYRANMKVSIWLIGYIIIMIYILIFIDLWGLT